MNANNLTIKAQEMLAEAFSIARSNSNQAVEPCHILHSMLKEEDSLATYLLAKIGANTSNIDAGAMRLIDRLAKVEGGEQYLSRDSIEV